MALNNIHTTVLKVVPKKCHICNEMAVISELHNSNGDYRHYCQKCHDYHYDNDGQELVYDRNFGCYVS